MKNRTDIINYFINKYGYESYLEIGIDNPNNNFNKIVCQNKIGVDPHKTCDFKMTSDDFFSQLKKTNFYDIIFIDGLHTSSQALKDIKNSLNCLSAEGTIIVHDCNPTSKKLQRPLEERHKGPWCGDVWKAFCHLRMNDVDLDMYVIDIDYGVGVIKNGKQSVFKPIISKEDLDYSFLENNRKRVLNLQSINDFLEREQYA